MHTSAPPKLETRREAGVLLHPTSLPGRYGIGDFGNEAVVFLDWAASAGMTLWQVLPLNPPGYGNSPYGCLSSFAGNPLLISPQRLLQDELLQPGDVEDTPAFDADHVEFERVAEYKLALLRTAWTRFNEQGSAAPLRESYDAYVAAPEQGDWLADYALYMALKKHGGGAPWWEWDAGLVQWEPQAIANARLEHADEIGFMSFLQWTFFRQWSLVREAAQARGIRIVGDVPIYVADDSADVWGHQELFYLGEDGRPTVVAGVPPDYFSETGQRWGNPLYRWELMRETGFRWWVARVQANLRFADLVRLDHFRGFAAYWEIQGHEPTAINGRWMPGPGVALFEAIREALGGELPLIAEDLGFITEDVHAMRRAIGVPGMRIVQFGFGQDDSGHLPHRYEPATVAYSGTHDNDTARSWFDTAEEDERARALTYLGVEAEGVPWALIRAAFTSVAETVIIPTQDILALGTETRMNTPGKESGNWTWRMAAAALTRADAENLRQLGVICGRG
ncbi:MAG: 4-alpha-glucanotransferase [Acidobacteriota bacterium]